MGEFKRIPQYTTYLFQEKTLSESTSKWKQISYEKSALTQVNPNMNKSNQFRE